MNIELLTKIQWFRNRIACADNYRKIYKCICDNKDVQVKLYSVSPGFYRYMIRLLQHGVMVELARIFESGRQNYDINKLISECKRAQDSFSGKISGEWFNLDAVIKEFEDAILKREEVLKKLKAQRDKIWMHIDKDYVTNPPQAEIDYPISWREVEDLINITENLLLQLEFGLNGEKKAMVFADGSDVTKLFQKLEDMEI